MSTKINKIIRVNVSKVGPGKPSKSWSWMREYDATDFVYEEEDITNRYKDCYFVKRADEFIIDNDLKYKDLDKLDLSTIKTYMFIPGTKFNRDYFKRLFGHLKKVILPGKADIVIYDNDSCSKYFSTEINYYYNAIDNNTLYVCKDEGYSFYKGLNWNYGYYYTVKNSTSKFKNKMININDILNLASKSAGPAVSSGSPVMLDNLSLNDALSIFKQCTAKSADVKKVGLDTVSGYSEKYILIKYLCFYCSNLIESIKPSSKSTFYKTKFNRYFRKTSITGKYTITEFAHICQLIESAKDIMEDYDDVDTKLFIDIINSADFSKLLCKVNQINKDISINLNVVNPFASNDDSVQSAASNIEEFKI